METLRASIMPNLPQLDSPPSRSDSTPVDFKKKETEHLKKEVSKNLSDKEGLGWEELIEKLLEMFSGDDANVEEVMDVLSSYKTKKSDWKKYAKFGKYKYTRNLVHEGNGKFNLMLLCWAPGNQSAIHDHSDAHCFVKCLQGHLLETKYHWPHEAKNKDGSCKVQEEEDILVDDVTYMSDELGLHRVENTSHSDGAVSLHLYSPPFNSCQVFDERTSNVITARAPMTFWSKFGEKVNRKKSERIHCVNSIAD